MMQQINHQRTSEISTKEDYMEIKLHTRKEVAQTLRMGLTALNDILMSGELPSYVIGGKRLVSEDDLNAYIASKRA